MNGTFLDERPIVERAALGLTPDERHEELLQSEAERGILLCMRQWESRRLRVKWFVC